jgi:hypothetical protein
MESLFPLFMGCFMAGVACCLSYLVSYLWNPKETKKDKDALLLLKIGLFLFFFGLIGTYVVVYNAYTYGVL